MSMYVDAMDFDPEKDSPSTRSIDLGNNKINLTREDPYGFWRISFDRGAVPVSLSGSFTTLDKALGAAKTYMANKGKKEVTE